jgi:superfamily II DNA or RNA helicase
VTRRNWRPPRRHGPGDEPDWVDPDLDDFDEFFPEDSPAPRPRPIAGQPSAPPPPVGWRQRLSTLNQVLQAPPPDRPWPHGRQILYVIDVAGSLEGLGLTLDVSFRQRKGDGSWSRVRPAKIRAGQIATLSDEADRKIMAVLLGPRNRFGVYGDYYSPYGDALHRYRLPMLLQETVLTLVCATGRCVLRVEGAIPELSPLRWDDGPPWECWLDVQRQPEADSYAISGSLRRDDERLPLSAPALLTAGGLVFAQGRVARLVDDGVFAWIAHWRGEGELRVSAEEIEEWLAQVLALPAAPRLDLPAELAYQEVAEAPRPRLVVRLPKGQKTGARLGCHLSFDYGGVFVQAGQSGRGILQPDRRRFLRRDPEVEGASAARLFELGARKPSDYASAMTGTTMDLSPRWLPRMVTTLLQEGWHVEAEGRRYRRAGAVHVEVASGIDWFELHGTVDFDGATASLPELLAALRRGESMVRLGDGTYGILPEEWLRRYAPLAGLGTVHGAQLRFTRAQVGLLDAMIAAQPEVSVDETFARAREELRRFEGIRPCTAPAGFVGELRPYQGDGLGWLQFLERFGFGGCLADDMGLGKTVMVLALLEERRARRAQAPAGPDRPGPSLAVVPRSLVFNWKQEAARFSPKLRVLDHTGAGRLAPGEHFDDYDLVITTYGTLRRDAADLAETRLDYAILDEAQAIKNAGTDAAKAARLLRADHRLALSGTPVENHLGELWSLFEFLNPGMLGAAAAFQTEAGGLRNPDASTRRQLARALRPFILRRTKEQVARDLPPKLEQTLACELEPIQRALYEELRRHYRQSLLGRLEREGLERITIQVLEALLRLRQAACHPGLIDPKRVSEGSAKLDALLPQLAEVVEEGHKALVFSQFVSLLSIVRDRLQRAGIIYEYLDGQTRDRAARVERFQTDPRCPLFLISLRAGGLGLNLTAADYVFLLDPWWNPAVEAQAIDRTHRIGQTRQVFAYRLIARDTVEEKILELQRHKRELADAIVGADGSPLRSLTREDLERLLS